jgi:hypothetical protein
MARDVDTAGGCHQDQVCHKARMSQRQLQGDVRAHRLCDDSRGSGDRSRDVVHQVVVAANVRLRWYGSKPGQINRLNVPLGWQPLGDRLPKGRRTAAPGSSTMRLSAPSCSCFMWAA